MTNMEKTQPIVLLAIAGQYDAIKILVNSKSTNLNIFDRNDGPSVFDILIQYAVNETFNSKKIIRDIFNSEAKKHNQNLKDLFLTSPLAKKINLNHKNIYLKIKNVLKFLHSFEKSQITIREFLSTFLNVFFHIPKCAISLITYCIKNRIFYDKIDLKDVSKAYYVSPKLLGTIKKYYCIEDIGPDMLVLIIAKTFSFVWKDTEFMLKRGFESYSDFLIAHGYDLFEPHETNQNLHNSFMNIVNEYLHKTINLNDMIKYEMLHMFSYFVYEFGSFMKFQDNDFYEKSILQLYNLYSHDYQAKFIIAKYFRLVDLSNDTIDNMFKSFLSSINMCAEIPRNECINMICAFIKCFKHLELNYENEWSDMTKELKYLKEEDKRKEYLWDEVIDLSESNSDSDSSSDSKSDSVPDLQWDYQYDKQNNTSWSVKLDNYFDDDVIICDDSTFQHVLSAIHH